MDEELGIRGRRTSETEHGSYRGNLSVRVEKETDLENKRLKEYLPRGSKSRVKFTVEVPRLKYLRGSISLGVGVVL